MTKIYKCFFLRHSILRSIHYLNLSHFNRPCSSFLLPCLPLINLPSHSGFLPQTQNASLRDSLILTLCRPLYFPFLPPPPSIIIALTLEGQLKCHIPVREPVWWYIVGRPVPFQSPLWLWLTVQWGRTDPSGQSNIRPLRRLMGTVSGLSAVSHLRPWKDRLKEKRSSYLETFVASSDYVCVCIGIQHVLQLYVHIQFVPLFPLQCWQNRPITGTQMFVWISVPINIFFITKFWFVPAHKLLCFNLPPA